MCINCRPTAFPRRDFLALLAMSAGAAGVAFSASPALAAAGPKTDLTASQALEKLKQGNARFAANAEVCAAELTQKRQAVAAAQAPWATIISCSDSRAPPELLFGGLGLGELFVARNAGNLVDAAELGTAEYGAAVLGSPLIVVLGHQRCGAVAAACDMVTKNATFPGAIGPMVEPIVPAARAVRDAPGDFVTNAVKESAKRTAAQLSERSTILADLARQNKVTIVSAYYELDSGRVEFAA
jgi:carbonic anhydrase